jgi:dTDP-4-dehydrorhamnose 3,5-epimerase
MRLKGARMKLIPSKLPGVYLIETDVFPDERGLFVKLFSKTDWQKENLLTNFCESYYSVSRQGVIRGMHFQIPPYEHTKLVYVPSGQITDVLLDIRKNSPTYGKYVSYEVSSQNHVLVYIPPGIAHGFEAISKETVVTYLQNGEHNAKADMGINTQSFGMKWQTKSFISSQRDQNLPPLSEFETPFS